MGFRGASIFHRGRRAISIIPISIDSGDFGRNAGLWQLEIEECVKFQEQELEMYNEDTKEWAEAQMGHGDLKECLGRLLILRIGFATFGGKLGGWGSRK